MDRPIPFKLPKKKTVKEDYDTIQQVLSYGGLFGDEAKEQKLYEKKRPTGNTLKIESERENKVLNNNKKDDEKPIDIKDIEPSIDLSLSIKESLNRNLDDNSSLNPFEMAKDVYTPVIKKRINFDENEPKKSPKKEFRYYKFRNSMKTQKISFKDLRILRNSSAEALLALKDPTVQKRLYESNSRLTQFIRTHVSLVGENPARLFVNEIFDTVNDWYNFEFMRNNPEIVKDFYETFTIKNKDSASHKDLVNMLLGKRAIQFDEEDIEEDEEDEISCDNERFIGMFD